MTRPTIVTDDGQPVASLDAYRRRKAQAAHPAGRMFCMFCGTRHNDAKTHAAICPERGA